MPMPEVAGDALNPVQTSQRGMEDAKRLKQGSSRQVTFWGGGGDTTCILNSGRPQQVKDKVQRRMGDLAPGGGFIFAAVHGVEPDVPPQNIVAMWQAFVQDAKY